MPNFFKACWNFPNFVLAFLGRNLDLWLKTFFLSLIGPAVMMLASLLTFSSSILGFLGGGAAAGQGGALAGGLGSIVIIAPIVSFVALFIIFLVDFALVALIMNRLTGAGRSLKEAFSIANKRKLLIIGLMFFYMLVFGVFAFLAFIPVAGPILSLVLQIALLIGFYFGLPSMVFEKRNPIKATIEGVSFFIKGFFYVLASHIVMIVIFAALGFFFFRHPAQAIAYYLQHFSAMSLSQTIIIVAAMLVFNSFFYTFFSTLRCACILAYNGELEGEGYSTSQFRIR